MTRPDTSWTESFFGVGPGRLSAIWILVSVLISGLCSPVQAGASDRAAKEFRSASVDRDAQTIKVHRVRPSQEKKPSLRFLKENMAFLRARIDGLESESRDREGNTDAIDPRWLDYLRMTSDIESAESRLDAQADSLNSGHLLGSIAELARFEAQLGELENLLAAESLRLDQIHEDFVGRQRTTLVVLLRGEGADRIPQGMTLAREDGVEVRVTVSSTLVEALGRGAIVEADHDFVEPREQWMALSLPGTEEEPGPVGYVEFAPVRDQVNFIEFDLSSMQSLSVEGWRARFWSRPHGDDNGETPETW